MSTSSAELERECRTFVRYLAKSDPSPYVVEKYSQAHTVLPEMGDDDFDSRLVAIASSHAALTFVVDVFARFFAPCGRLRKKLVLLIAILEVSPPYFHQLIGPSTRGRFAQLMFLSGRLLLFGVALVAGSIVLLPIWLLPLRGKRGTP